MADREDGRSSWSSADHWADRLRERQPNGKDDYQYEVRPVIHEGQLTGKFGFIFYKRREKEHSWAYYVKTSQVIEQLQRTSTSG